MFTKIYWLYKFHINWCSQAIFHLGVYSVIHAFHIYYMIWVIFNIRNLHNAVGHYKFHENWSRKHNGHKLTYNYICTVKQIVLVKVCVLHYRVEDCSHQRNVLYCYIQHCIDWSTKLNCLWYHNTNTGWGNSYKNMLSIWSICIQYDFVGYYFRFSITVTSMILMHVSCRIV